MPRYPALIKTQPPSQDKSCRIINTYGDPKAKEVIVECSDGSTASVAIKKVEEKEK